MSKVGTRRSKSSAGSRSPRVVGPRSGSASASGRAGSGLSSRAPGIRVRLGISKVKKSNETLFSMANSNGNQVQIQPQSHYHQQDQNRDRDRDRYRYRFSSSKNQTSQSRTESVERQTDQNQNQNQPQYRQQEQQHQPHLQEETSQYSNSDPANPTKQGQSRRKDKEEDETPFTAAPGTSTGTGIGTGKTVSGSGSGACTESDNSSPERESSLLLLNRTAKYRKIIIFLAIVDIVMSIFVLVSWGIMIFLLVLIFTATTRNYSIALSNSSSISSSPTPSGINEILSNGTNNEHPSSNNNPDKNYNYSDSDDVNTNGDDNNNYYDYGDEKSKERETVTMTTDAQADFTVDVDSTPKISWRHLETVTIAVYIIQPVFYSLSMVTAIMMAHAIEEISFAILIFLNSVKDFMERHHVWDVIQHWIANKMWIIGKSLRSRILATWTLQLVLSLIQIFAVLLLFRMWKSNARHNVCKEPSTKSKTNNGIDFQIHQNPHLCKKKLKKDQFNKQAKFAVLFIVTCSMLQIPNIHNFFYDYDFHLVDGISTSVDTLFRFLGLYFIFKFKRDRESRRDLARHNSVDTEAFITSPESDDEENVLP